MQLGPDMLLRMAIIADDWRPRELGTLVFVERDNEVLLIEKKVGHGAGMINVPGGRLEPGEMPVACALREVHEEVMLNCLDLHPAAHLRFHDTVNGFAMRGFAFVTQNFEGEAKETEEAVPFWCHWDEVPYHRMWENDSYWWPCVRARELLRGDFVFEDDRLVKHEVQLIGPTAKSTFAREFCKSLK
jgi:8-oxo-dGTP diphosphatase